MKVKDVDRLRKELYRNLKSLYFRGCDVREIGRVEYEEKRLRPENKEIHPLRVLINPMCIKKYHWDSEKHKEVYDNTIYLVVDEEDQEIAFYHNDFERQCFKYWSTMPFDEYQNRTELFMDIAIYITRFGLED